MTFITILLMKLVKEYNWKVCHEQLLKIISPSNMLYINSSSQRLTEVMQLATSIISAT